MTSISVGVALALFALVVSLTPIAYRLANHYGLSLLYGFRGPIPPPEGATIIAIDRTTIEWLRETGDELLSGNGDLASCLPASAREDLKKIRGPGSLPRSVYACLTKRLSQIGFTVVIFDILFSVAGTDEDDTSFARAISEHGAAAILVGLERSTVSDGATEVLVEREVQPVASIAENAAAAGTFVVPRTGGPVYGYWRKVPGFEDIQSLPDEAFRLHRLRSKDGGPDVTEKTEFEYLWLYGPPGSIKTISAHGILSGKSPEAVRSGAHGSVAFVGASDPQMSNFPDTFPSFFHGASGANISGVELIATAFLNLHSGERLTPLSPPMKSIVTIGFAFVLGFMAQTRGKFAILTIPSVAILYLIGSAWTFSTARILMPIGTPIFLVTPIAFLLAVVFRYRFARTLIMRLAPAPVARRMLASATDYRSEAKSNEASVVFFDLIGSTRIAEKVSPVDFSTLLNKYHETVSTNVENNHGLVVTFAGDGVMAAFTRSDAGADHAMHACNAALSVIRAMQSLNAETRQGGFPPLHLRIGVNSGSVAEGEIGATDRFNFSVVGDVVNLAAHLEQLGKTLFPTEQDIIIVGAATRQLASAEGLRFVDCGARSIPGHDRPESVFRLLPD